MAIRTIQARIYRACVPGAASGAFDLEASRRCVQCARGLAVKKLDLSTATLRRPAAVLDRGIEIPVMILPWLSPEPKCDTDLPGNS
jgi:hypothetical protein